MYNIYLKTHLFSLITTHVVSLNRSELVIDHYCIITYWDKENQVLMLISEFWEDHFKCRYPNAPRTPYNRNYTKNCTTHERLTKQDTAFEDQLQFVSDAVMAFAYAFR